MVKVRTKWLNITTILDEKTELHRKFAYITIILKCVFCFLGCWFLTFEDYVDIFAYCTPFNPQYLYMFVDKAFKLNTSDFQS